MDPSGCLLLIQGVFLLLIPSLYFPADERNEHVVSTCESGIMNTHLIAQALGRRAFNWGGLGSIEPPKFGGGIWEKGSIDRTINQLL